MSAFDVLTPPTPEYQQLVSAIDVPILMVIGDAGVVSIETARQLQGLNSHIQVEQIHGAGHGVQYDQPERFASVVRSFARSVIVSRCPTGNGSLRSPATQAQQPTVCSMRSKGSTVLERSVSTSIKE